MATEVKTLDRDAIRIMVKTTIGLVDEDKKLKRTKSRCRTLIVTRRQASKLAKLLSASFYESIDSI